MSVQPEVRLKVMTVVGTRPEIIRLCRVIPALDVHTDHTLVHTGQNYDYELNEIFFEELGLRKPDYFLGAAGGSAAQTIGKIIISIDELLETYTPDALLVLGDTNSCMAVLPAKRHRIPTFHMEAGNRCFDQRVPEEINRKIVDHVSDINLTYSAIARDYLLREGLPPDQIICTGSPMCEVLQHHRQSIDESTILESLSLIDSDYFLVSAHREENIESDRQFNKLVTVLNTVAARFSKRIIVSTHPRTKYRIEKADIAFDPLIEFMKPMGYFDYNRLQLSARAVLSDSGTISEESSILNFPALNIREAHERPEGMEEASVMMVGLDIDRICQALAILETQGRGDKRTLNPVRDYSSNNVSDKVVRIIHSYTDYVRRVVWREYSGVSGADG